MDPLTRDTFQPHVGSAFRLVAADEQTLDLTLAECHELTGSHGESREPFSLLFQAAADDPVLEQQQIVPLEHPDLGRLEIFLVPLGPDKDGRWRYEAVFT